MNQSVNRGSDKNDIRAENDGSCWQSESSDGQSDEDGGEVVQWDGSEAELIVNDDGEDYEENQTGMKFKYTLSEKEIYEIFKSTDNYKKNSVMMKNQIIIQSVVIAILFVLWLLFGNIYYAVLIILPILCIGVVTVYPILAIKKLAKKFFSGEEIHTEIYPDKIVVDIKGREREIPLNGTAQYQELAGQIIIHPKEGGAVIIPIRVIEPELLPDVQAVIVAGTHPWENK